MYYDDSFIIQKISMAHNLTPTIVKAKTFNSSIIGLYDPTIQKYIDRTIALVWSYVSMDQFKQENGDYLFPDNFIIALVCVIEYIFVDQWMISWWNNDIKSEKIGDYSYTKKDSNLKSIGSLDLPTNIIAMLDEYVSLGFWYSMSVGWYDREYN